MKNDAANAARASERIRVREEATKRRRDKRNLPVEDNRTPHQQVRDQIDDLFEDNVTDLPPKKPKKWTERPENWRNIGEHAQIYGNESAIKDFKTRIDPLGVFTDDQNYIQSKFMEKGIPRT